jgi:DNA-binding transcriptional regulator YiaG
MEHALGRRLKPEDIVHHKNGDCMDNRVENLEVMTWEGHSWLHAKQGDIATYRAGEANPQAKLTEEKVRAIRRLRARGVKRAVVAKAMGVSLSTISGVTTRTWWKHIS